MRKLLAIIFCHQHARLQLLKAHLSPVFTYVYYYHRSSITVGLLDTIDNNLDTTSGKNKSSSMML